MLFTAELSATRVTFTAYALESLVMTLPCASSGTTTRFTFVFATIVASFTAPLPINRDVDADAAPTVTFASWMHEAAGVSKAAGYPPQDVELHVLLETHSCVPSICADTAYVVARVKTARALYPNRRVVVPGTVLRG